MLCSHLGQLNIGHVHCCGAEEPCAQIKNTPFAITGILYEEYSKLPKLWAAQIHGKRIHLRACLAQVIRSDTLVLDDIQMSVLNAPRSLGLHCAVRRDITDHILD